VCPLLAPFPIRPSFFIICVAPAPPTPSPIFFTSTLLRLSPPQNHQLQFSPFGKPTLFNTTKGSLFLLLRCLLPPRPKRLTTFKRTERASSEFAPPLQHFSVVVDNCSTTPSVKQCIFPFSPSLLPPRLLSFSSPPLPKLHYKLYCCTSGCDEFAQEEESPSPPHAKFASRNGSPPHFSKRPCSPLSSISSRPKQLQTFATFLPF